MYEKGLDQHQPNNNIGHHPGRWKMGAVQYEYRYQYEYLQ
jgi:hypothetical protein